MQPTAHCHTLQLSGMVSRAVVARSGLGVQLTTDHTALLQSERERVIDAGGSVGESKDGTITRVDVILLAD